ncbi:MAG: alcohol dehydrogenase catalytic domain-containing protein [Candidatus Bipolaricaulota bacterium]|nr:alcohol dehydrogenase catalytic domain-containing protein [Candidatus Bipolaricaulota bacterium]
MKQANLVGEKEIAFEEVEKPTPEDGEVLIEVKSCGICGSDVHSYQGEHPFVHPPIVLGHEFSGVVSETGKDVKNVNPKDKVVVEPNIVCNDCYNCNHGRYNICENLQVIGNVGYDGAFADFIAVPEEKVIKIPEDMGFEEGALVEPTAVGVHAVRISDQKLGDKVVVIGAGTIGLVTLVAAKDAGASETIITDLEDSRLERAKNLGADHAINTGELDDGLSEFIQAEFGKDGADIIFDCVGFDNTLNQAIEVARKGTQIMLVGVPKGNLDVNMAFVQDRELDIQGSLMYVQRDFKTAVNMIDRGQIKTEDLITNRFDFEELEEAFELAIDPSNMGEKLKVMVNF